MKEDYGKGEETVMGLVMSLSDLKDLLEQQARISGKKVERNKGYTNAVVKVQDIKNVAEVERQIKKWDFGPVPWKASVNRWREMQGRSR